MTPKQIAEVVRRLTPVFRDHWFGGADKNDSKRRWQVFVRDVRRALAEKGDSPPRKRARRVSR